MIFDNLVLMAIIVSPRDNSIFTLTDNLGFNLEVQHDDQRVPQNMS